MAKKSMKSKPKGLYGKLKQADGPKGMMGKKGKGSMKARERRLEKEAM